ncbi:hypothetical protein E2C01_041863 [Portunus trituberculatus]|uniref:Uncharacterized protein n=1 Tax=Portunus trituberculatus TaxID=210409 RepID=A0A5B7FT04_PORTR|nr:hypothetical protein [Portunus trituberculatus]
MKQRGGNEAKRDNTIILFSLLLFLLFPLSQCSLVSLRPSLPPSCSWHLEGRRGAWRREITPSVLEHAGTVSWRGEGVLRDYKALGVKETHDGRQSGNFVICGEGRRKEEEEEEEEEEYTESLRCCLLAFPCLSYGKVTNSSLTQFSSRGGSALITSTTST